MGAFCYQGFPLVPIERSLNANQCKVLLTDQLCTMMKYFHPEGSGLFQNDNNHIMEWLDEYKNYINYILLFFIVTRSQANWTHMGDFGAVFTTILKTWAGNIFWKSGVDPSSTFPENLCQGNSKLFLELWWLNILLKHYGYPLIYHCTFLRAGFHFRDFWRKRSVDGRINQQLLPS